MNREVHSIFRLGLPLPGGTDTISQAKCLRKLSNGLRRLGESLRTPVGMAEKHDLAHNWHTNTQNGQGQAPELPLQVPALLSLTAVPRQGLEPRTY